jgi:predicted phosphodiesterase
MPTPTNYAAIERIRNGECEGLTNRAAAKLLGCSESAVSNYRATIRAEADKAPAPVVSLPDPAPIAGGPSLPDPVKQTFEPLDISTPGPWLVLGDVHLPYHDKRTVELAIQEARRRNVVGVLLNGDILDSHEVSDHERDRDALSYFDEIQIGQRFLAWLRSQLPAARIVYKEGNHDDRVQRYVLSRAPALAGIEGLDLPSFLKMRDHGVEWINDKRVIRLGKLHVLHGHEYRGGGGVNPARWLFLRAVSTAMCGHFHRTSEHHQRGLNQKSHGVWSVGCACFLHPRYAPLNEWNHGFAFVTVGQDGGFTVENKRVMGGQVV